MKRRAGIDLSLALAAGLLALALYVRTLAPGVLGGDSGELQFAAWLGSLAHPTGYPLFLLMGYAWTHLLPWGDPAWRMNLLTAACAASAVGLMYLLALNSLRLAGPRHQPDAVYRLLAGLAAAILALTPTFWSQSVIAEVYALQAALFAGVLLALVVWGSRAPAERSRAGSGPLYAAALLFGLGLAHHRSVILLAPAIAVYLAQTRPPGESRRVYAERLARTLPLVALPLLLYLYIPLRAPYTPYVRLPLGAGQTLELYQPTLAGFWQYVTGQVFETAFRTFPAALAQLPRAGQLLVDEVGWPGCLLALAGLAWLVRRSRRRLLALTGLSLVAILLFNLFYGIGDIYVYYIPAYLIVALWIVFGLGALGTVLAWLLQRRAGTPLPALPRVASRPAILYGCAILAIALPAWLLAANFQRMDRHADHSAADFWRPLLAAPIPAQAVLVSNDRDEMMPLWYYQYVEGRRSDLTGLFPLIVQSPEWADIGRVGEQALQTGRPAFLIKPMPGLEIKFRLAPEGQLVRLIGPVPVEMPEHQRAVTFADSVRLNGYDLQPEMLQAGGTLTVTLHWQVLRPLTADYSTFVHLVNAGGGPAGQDDRRPGGVYYPSHLWQPGEVLQDVHILHVPSQAGQPPYKILAGLYTLAPDLQHLGEPQVVGQVAAERPADDVPQAAVGNSYAFGDELALLGYQAEGQGRVLMLRLFWQALRAADHDYTLFVHVLDVAGKIVAQHDGPAGGGSLPTTTWPAGYVLADTVQIDLPADLPAGTYQLEAGAYDPATLAPLPARDHLGELLPGAAPLGQIDLPFPR